MEDKNNFEKEFNSLMAAMLLKSMIGDKADKKLVPFNMAVTFTPTSISCEVTGNKKLLDDIEGGAEWFAETASLITPIMREQTNKFFELAKKNFGLKEVGRSNTDEFDDFVRTVLSGGGKTQPVE